jgi:hypothetical protein
MNNTGNDTLGASTTFHGEHGEKYSSKRLNTVDPNGLQLQRYRTAHLLTPDGGAYSVSSALSQNATAFLAPQWGFA